MSKDVKEPPVVRMGMGYTMEVPEIGTSFHLTRVRRRSDEVTGYMTVKTHLSNVRTFSDDKLMVGSLNILGTRTRKDWATALKERTPGFDIDWNGLLTYFAERIISSEMEGEPIVEVGSQPVPQTSGAWAIKPFLPKGVTSILYAPGGSGKSQTALALSLSVRLGTEIVPGFSPSIVGPVLYLDWETQKEVIAERLQRICKGLGRPPMDIFYRRCVKPLADDAEEISWFVAQKGIVMLVVDSCEPAMGRGNEYGDANEKALRLFDAIRLIGVSTLVVDHVSKSEMRMNGKTSGLLPYGSIYKINLARSAWEMRPVQSMEDDSVVVALHHTKANDSKLHEPIGIRISFRSEDTDVTSFHKYDGPIDDAHSRPEEIVMPSPSKSRIMELVDESRMRPADIARVLNMPEGTVRSTLKRGLDDGTFVKDANDLWTVRKL